MGRTRADKPWRLVLMESLWVYYFCEQERSDFHYIWKE